MAAFEALSPQQFSTERSLIEQSNPSEYIQKVRGTQTKTANIFRPAFSHELRQVRGFQSPASARPLEEEEDEE